MYGIIELRILEQAKAFAEKAKLRIDAVGLSNRCQVIAGDVFVSLPGAGKYIL